MAVQVESDRSFNVGAEDAGPRIFQARENFESRQTERIARSH